MNKTQLLNVRQTLSIVEFVDAMRPLQKTNTQTVERKNRDRVRGLSLFLEMGAFAYYHNVPIAFGSY